MSRQVIGYVVRATRSDGQVDEYEVHGTGLETLARVQDKVNELNPLVGVTLNSIYQGALYADRLPPPQTKTQATRHRREIA